MNGEFNEGYDEYDEKMEGGSSDRDYLSDSRFRKCPVCHEGIMADCKPYRIMMCINCGSMVDRGDFS